MFCILITNYFNLIVFSGFNDNNNDDNIECLVITADETDAYRLTKFKKAKQQKEKYHKERDIIRRVLYRCSVELAST